MCTVVPPRVAPTGSLRVTTTVSSASSRASFTTVNAMFLAVCPASKVRVPPARVKSVPEPEALPPVTA